MQGRPGDIPDEHGVRETQEGGRLRGLRQAARRARRRAAQRRRVVCPPGAACGLVLRVCQAAVCAAQLARAARYGINGRPRATDGGNNDDAATH